MITETKENKKRLFKPGPVSASHIISRCVGGNRCVIEASEDKRINRVERILQEAHEISAKMKKGLQLTEQQQIENQNIDLIISEITKLNETLKKRNEELINRSLFMDQIVHDLSTVNEDEQELLKHIDEEILENEMKRRAAFDFPVFAHH